MADAKSKRRSVADAAPAYPVRKAEDVFATGEKFDIVHADTFTGRYGTSWRLRCVTVDGDGTPWLLLMQANAVRDSAFETIASWCAAGETVGPNVLARRVLADGHPTWELVDPDAPEPEAAKK